MRSMACCGAIVLAVCLVATDLRLGAQASRTAAQPATTARRHALLIGVTSYPNLAEQYQLAGPVNDVALVRTTLLERFGVSADRIVELTAKNGPAGRPTYANIRREFERLAKVLERGDQVLILFAGHGSQQPDNDPPGKDEADGLDEIFLPADAAGWDGKAGVVQNAIVDDEIGMWVRAIRDRGAFVWLVFDACQSSTLTRGDVERSRQVPASALVPKELLDKAGARTRGPNAADSDVVGLPNDAGGIAALFAAQTTEPTPEKHLPDANGPVHGLFTYTLVEVLGQSANAISYRDLVERITQRYRAMGRGGPTPGFEGGGLDEPVMDSAVRAHQPRMLVGEQRNGTATVRAGSIDGLTRGTILRIFPPAGTADADRLIGHVKVIDLDPTSAKVEPVTFGDVPAPAPGRLVPNARADVALLDYGGRTLKVGLHPDARQARTAAGLEAALAQVSQTTSGLAMLAPSPETADWIANIKGGEVILAPASGWRVDADHRDSPDAQAPFRVGSPDSSTLAHELGQALSRIARSRTLMQLAVAPAVGASDVDVQIELIRYRNADDASGEPVPTASGGRVLHVGDSVAFRARNTGVTPVDVTLLFIDSQYGIKAVFPARDAEADGRLDRGAVVTTPRMTINADTLGLEQIVALAVQASSIRTDFRYLEQPNLELARTRGSAGQGTSALEQLLNATMYGQGTTRGLAAREVGRHAIRMVTWRTEASSRSGR